MPHFRTSVTTVFVSALCAFGLLSASTAYGLEANVEGHGSQQYANVNESGLNTAVSALLTFLVTQNGVGVNLGAPSFSSKTTSITLPTSIILVNVVTPVKNCSFTPTQFYSWAKGQYAIRVVPYTANPSCK